MGCNEALEPADVLPVVKSSWIRRRQHQHLRAARRHPREGARAAARVPDGTEGERDSGNVWDESDAEERESPPEEREGGEGGQRKTRAPRLTHPILNRGHEGGPMPPDDDGLGSEREPTERCIARNTAKREGKDAGGARVCTGTPGLGWSRQGRSTNPRRPGAQFHP